MSGQRAFSGFVCWQSEHPPKIIDTEALQPSDAVFLATHSPMRMFRRTWAEAESQVYSEEDFLQDFLAPSDFAFVPILGQAGTGKSHLVRWLRTRIPNSPTRKVILVPKSGTNLRRIVELILETVEGDVFDQYREKLKLAVDEMDHERAKEALLADLAIECGPNGTHRSDTLSEEQQFFVDYLPALMKDPVFHQRLVQQGGLLDRLVKHTVGDPGRDRERLESPRRIEESDLPWDISATENFGQMARQVYVQLRDDAEIRSQALDWLNEHLDHAIARLLNISGTDLQELMMEVREALNGQGVELVLLIEDFAKLQGIDRALLEALLVRRQQGARTLCALRTAFACTRGYFQRLEDTVRDRTEFQIDLDLPLNSGESIAEGISPAEVRSFVSRYLNAIRLGPARLNEWYSQHIDDADSHPLPNACIACEHTAICNATFGAEVDYGLYPLNPPAIREMVTRESALRREGHFDPRGVLNLVVKPTLSAATLNSRLERGQFPPPVLVEQLGGSQLPLGLKQKVIREDPANHARRLTLLEFWASNPEELDLSPGIHRAFQLPRLGVDDESELGEAGEVESDEDDREEPEAGDLGADEPRDPETVGRRTEPELPEVRAIDDWRNRNTPLPQELTNRLRGLIRQSVSTRIPWHVLALAGSSFSGAGKNFDNTSINFKNQTTQKRARSVELNLPLEEHEDLDTALALQALLLFNHHKSWDFEYGLLSGAAYYRTLQRLLEDWAHHVVRQIRLKDTESADWYPELVASELLVLDSLLRSDIGQLSDVDLVNAVFADHGSHDDFKRSESWSEIQTSLTSHRSELQDMVGSRCALTKGTAELNQLVDASRLLPTLRELRTDWTPKAGLPAEENPKFKILFKLRSKVEERLHDAVLVEREQLLDLRKRLDDQLSETDLPSIANTLKSSHSAALAEGVFAGAQEATIRQIVEDWTPNSPLVSSFQDSLNILDEISSDSAPQNLLWMLSSVDVDAIARVEESLGHIEAFVEATGRRVQEYDSDLPEQEEENLKGKAAEAIAEAIDILVGLGASDEH